MNYLRSLFLNFLIIFFIDRVSPGIEIENFENIPNIGADVLFALVVGFLNASVFFFLALLEAKITNIKLALITFLVTFTGFIAIGIFPFGVRVVNPLGVIVGGGVVWVVAYISNRLEWKHYEKS